MKSFARAMAPSLLVFGLWALFAAYLGRAANLAVNTAASTEFVDHVIPGTVVVIVAVLALVRRFSLVPGVLASLAGFWMVATHVPLLLQAFRHQVGWGPALNMCIPALVVLLIAGAMTVSVLDLDGAQTPAAAAPPPAEPPSNAEDGSDDPAGATQAAAPDSLARRTE